MSFFVGEQPPETTWSLGRAAVRQAYVIQSPRIQRHEAQVDALLQRFSETARVIVDEYGRQLTARYRRRIDHIALLGER